MQKHPWYHTEQPYFKPSVIAVHSPLQTPHLFSCLLAAEMNQYYLGKPFQRHKLHSTCISSAEVLAQCWSVLFYPNTRPLPPHRLHVKGNKQFICIVRLCFNRCTCQSWLHLGKAFNSHRFLAKPVGVLRICRRKVLFVLLLCVTHAETYPPNPQRVRDWVLSSDCYSSRLW